MLCSDLVLLSSPFTPAKNHQLANKVVDISFTDAPYAFYIGLNRVNSNDNGFQWNDGTFLSDTWSNWHTGEPNNSGGTTNQVSEGCVIMGWTFSADRGLKWTDVTCNMRARYVCQRQIGKVIKYLLEALYSFETLIVCCYSRPEFFFFFYLFG